MRKVRTIDFDLVGIDSEGKQAVRDTYSCDVWDPTHTADDAVFRATNVPGPGERAMRGNPNQTSSGGADQTFVPRDIPAQKIPRGGSPV